MNKYLIQISLLLFIISACKKAEDISPVPEIHYKDFSLYRGVDILGNHIYIGELLFSFIDGDADFGIYYGDTTRFNIFLKPFEKISGEYFRIEALPDSLNNYYVRYNPKLSRTGQNKIIKAEIKIEIYYPLNIEFDTIRYEFFVMDRARNFSNTETTEDIGFR